MVMLLRCELEFAEFLPFGGGESQMSGEIKQPATRRWQCIVGKEYIARKASLHSLAFNPTHQKSWSRSSGRQMRNEVCQILDQFGPVSFDGVNAVETDVMDVTAF